MIDFVVEAKTNMTILVENLDPICIVIVFADIVLIDQPFIIHYLDKRVAFQIGECFLNGLF